jgi:hypothetical protein
MATSTPNVGIFYMPQIYDMGPTALLPLWTKARWGLRVRNREVGTRGQRAKPQTTEAAFEFTLEQATKA